MNASFAHSNACRALILLNLLATAGCGDGRTGSIGNPRGSVVVITCDTLRVNHLGFHGAPRATSPALDAFAAEAVVFDNAWSTAPMTLPALSSLFTKHTPDELGVGISDQFLLAAEVETLPEVLAGAGVESCGNRFERRAATLPVLDRGARAQPGFRVLPRPQGDARTQPPDVGTLRPGDDAGGDRVARCACRAWAGPCFLWVRYIEPHGPYTSGVPIAAGATGQL